MRLIKGPAILPYPPKACVVTNRNDGDFIDFQTVIDTPGPTRLTMRATVVEEAAELLGMVPGRRVKELEDQLATYSKDLDDLRDTMTIYADFEEKMRQKELTPA